MADLFAVRPIFVARLRQALADLLAAPGPIKPVLLIRAPGGLGKTRVTAELVRRQRVVWFSPKNTDQAQLEGFIAVSLPDVTPLPGPGPLHPTVTKRIARGDPGACLEPQRVQAVELAGLGRFIRRQACMPCPQRKACPYENWATSGDWLFSSHARLVLDNVDWQLFKDRNLVVIDESPLTSMLAGVTFTEAQIHDSARLLRALQPARSENAAAEAFALLFETASALLQSPPAHRQRVAVRDLVADLGFQFVRRVASSQHLETAQYKDPTRRTVDPAAVSSFLKASRFPKDLTEKLHQLADALADDAKGRPATVLLFGSLERAGGIAAGHFKPLPIPPSLPVVILDATADSMLLELALGRPVVPLIIEVDQASTILQTYDYRYPASTLLDPKGKAIKRIVACIEKYRVDNPTHRIGLVMKKTVFEDAAVKTMITQVVAEADVRFFWSLRGDNAMEHFDAVYVIGAPELQSLDAEARVRAFMTRITYDAGDDKCSYEATSLPIESTGTRRVVDRWGDEVVLEERGFGMNFESLVYRLFHQEEYIQALLRARPYDPMKKKNIFFFSKTFLGELDVELVSEDELLGLDVLVQAAAILALASTSMSVSDLARKVGVDRSTLYRHREKKPKLWQARIAGRLR